MIMDKKEIKRIIVAGLLSVSLLAGAYFLVVYEPKEKLTEISEVDIYSSLVSEDPKQSAANFITANGTMGNVEDDITQAKMSTNEAVYDNSQRRLVALYRLTDAVIPGGIIIDGREKDNVATHTMDLDSPYIYSVDNVEIGEPSNPEKLTVFTEDGQTDYDSVKVKAVFDSTIIHYTRAHDTSYDGTHTQISNTEKFEVEVVLVKSGDLWFIYDVTQSEEMLNERFASWSGISKSSVDHSLDKKTGEFVLEGVETYIQE